MVSRITGSSGFDVDGTVTKLMTAARMPLDKLTQNKQWLQWQTDDFRSINSKILELRTLAFNSKLQSNFLAKKSSSSNEGAVSATATANATEGVYKVIVNQLAAAASLTSSAGLGGDTSKTLGDPAGVNLSADTTLTIGGQKGTATINVKKTDSIAQFIANINGKSSVTGVKLNYDSTLDRLFFVSTSTGAATKVDLKAGDPSLLGNAPGTIGLKFAGVTTSNTGQSVVGTRAFTNSTDLIDSTLTGSQTRTLRITYNTNNYVDVITSTKTMGQFIDELNGSAFGKTGVSAYLDSSGHLAFNNPDQSKAIGFLDTTVPAPATSIVTTMGLNAPTVTSGLSVSTVNTSSAYQAANPTTIVTGQDANILFNGVAGSYSTNTFTVAGINMTVKTAGSAPTYITVSQDVDATFNGIKAFVDKYNETIAMINSKISENKNRDYLPLTDAQKQNMKEADITSWTNKAKEGTLHNDSVLSNALSQFRNGLSKSVSGIPSGDVSQLFQIGITTGAYQDKGKLLIDEAKLKSAIAKNPDQVQKLFNADDGNTANNDGQGLAVRMYNQTQNLMTQLNSKAGTSTSIRSMYLLGKQMNDIDKKVINLNMKLNDLETRYYKQFTAMDSAINRMNTQFASFQSSFGK